MKRHRMTPEQLYEFNQSRKPRQWAFAILKMKTEDRPAALEQVPEQYREWVQHIVEDQLWKQRWRKRLSQEQR